jgi:shikimate kinase
VSDGYYEPHPTVRLAGPLVLVGHPGSDVGSIGHDLCARTGLPFNDVARSVEARAGRSLLRILSEDGAGVLAELEEGRLHAALERLPCGVVVVSSGAVARSGGERWLAGAARMIAVRRPIPELLRRMRRTWAVSPGSSELAAGPPADVAGLEALLAPWQAALAAAHVQLEAGERHSSRVAEDIRRHETGVSLQQIGGRR